METSVVTTLETTTTTTTIPPRPRLEEARVEGAYRLVAVLISSDIPGADARFTGRWTIRSRCRSGGGCDVVVRSASGWRKRAAYVNGRYRFVRTARKAYTCGSGSDIDYYVDATWEYNFAVTRMRLIDGEWRALRLKGVFHAKGDRGCGFSGPPDERYALRLGLVP